MTGVDTNVLVRYIMMDDARQYAAATRLLDEFTEQSPGFISMTAIAELVWVLRTTFKMARQMVARTLIGFLQQPEFVVERADEVSDAVHRFNGGRADFADYLIERSGRHAGCSRTMTFDAGAASCAGMTLLPAPPAHSPRDSPAPSSVSAPSTAKMTAAMP